MRSLHRDKRKLWYALATDTRPIVDEYGNDTLEVETVYSSPLPLLANVSANMGVEAVQVFGAQTEYSRTVSITGNCPLVEGCRIWFGVEPTEEYNYTVARVADSKNVYFVALREVARGV